MNEQSGIVGDLLELNDELVRVLGISECLGGIEGNNVVGDDFVRLVGKVGFL
jgi:hypothetical protein